MKRLLSLFVCSHFLFIILPSAALDTITTDKTIRDGDTVVSAKGFYELGFFSPGNSKNRYVGIWYKKIATGTVVWVANRNIPLTDTSGVLMLKSNGVLVLVNISNASIWSSSSARSLNNPKAQLLDSGNLVVSDGNYRDNEHFAWQSFDYPGDTLLPGMKLGRNLVTGMESRITSWKSTDDPVPGEYAIYIEPHGYPQLFLWKNSSVEFSAGLWNGNSFGGSPSLKALIFP